GSLIFLRHLSLIVTDLPWFFDPARIAAFDPPLVAGSLLPGLEPDAVCGAKPPWPRHLKPLESDLSRRASPAPHPGRLRRPGPSGRLCVAAPKTTPCSTRICTALPAAGKALDWPLFTHAQLPAGLASSRCLPSLPRHCPPVERALPALFGLTSRLGQLCRCSASGFVRSLWGVEIVVAH
uniref:Secreted protein n=1 Tax=Macrostomum lignano TaxID=282301 RepID=A0A1I8FG93_9PLAT